MPTQGEEVMGKVERLVGWGQEKKNHLLYVFLILFDHVAFRGMMG